MGGFKALPLHCKGGRTEISLVVEFVMGGVASAALAVAAWCERALQGREGGELIFVLKGGSHR